MSSINTLSLELRILYVSFLHFLKIFYSRFNYKWAHLAATQGGMWGLLFGSSCVSFYEIVYLLYRIARTFVERCGNKNYGENKNSDVVRPM